MNRHEPEGLGSLPAERTGPPGEPTRGSLLVPLQPGARPRRATALPCLVAETVRVGDALVCSFTGDMILDSEPAAARALGAALDRRPALLAVDLAGVELFTSTGLNLLLTVRRRALDAGVPLVLVAPSTRTMRVLELTETTALFPVHATAEEALRHRPPDTPSG
ncbi:STAS domain-containing protein [Kitasatospora sp. NPDC091335]|uniref:STAS domain-containing protein n=1 Tax=Kitasatospora sp. NPDC091335 TaxID=3364085 RepID=UPI0038107C88